MYASIIISQQSKEIDRVFWYFVPVSLADKLVIGMRVIVPFGRGNKPYEGYVTELMQECDIPQNKLKPVLSMLDDYPVFTKASIELAYMMREKYFSTLSACFACMLPGGIKMREGLRKSVKTYEPLAGAKPNKLTEKQKQAYEYIKQNAPVSSCDIKNNLGFTSAVVTQLIKKELVTEKTETVRRKPFLAGEFSQTEPFKLSLEQKKVYDFIYSKIERGITKPTLIKGVTGSGKTEIYMRLIESIIQSGKQAIMLVPEISLTPQTVGLFTARFKQLVTVTHSRLSAGERFDQWERARLGEVSVIIGPRSAVFAPFTNLGIIIIDEEHEHSYQSEQSPKYSAAEVALLRCAIEKAHVVLGSATPRLETYYAACGGVFDLCRLNERINRIMPNVEIIDMREEMASGNMSVFSNTLIRSLNETLESGKQALLFLNRRGFSTFVSCRACGYVMNCAECSVSLTYHKQGAKLVCHYCGKQERVPENCPQCGSKHIKFFGAGTQKIQDEVKRIFPNARTLRMDSDTTTEKHAHEKILTEFREHKADVLVGTQMIAKGLDYPFVTLVGIISADTSINLSDFRSGETTFQLLTQAAGRAGRAEYTGKCIIQTYSPEHYSVVYARNHDYDGFYEHEIEVRRQLMYPPFTYLFSLMFSGANEKDIIEALFYLAQIMKHYNKKELFEILGPAPLYVSKVNNTYRWRLIVKSKDEEKLRLFCLFCIDKLKKTRNTDGVVMHLTLNPYSLM